MSHDERGATAVFVAVSMIGLLAVTAFSFDFGRVYIERRELQVGAESAALAIALDCAQGKCVGGYDAAAEADVYADSNVGDGMAWIQSVDLDMAAQSVHVVTGTEDAGGDHVFDLAFGGVVGFDGLTVGAEATAVWGAPGKAKALPLAFSDCEWQSFGEPGYVDENPDGFLHRAAAVRNGLLPPATGYAYEAAYVTIYFHGQAGMCHYSPSGQDLPGGFGWLDGGTSCEIEVNTGSWLTVDPGSSPAAGCDETVLDDMVGTVQFIPYFDQVRNTGSNAEIHVSGFGALYITGYYFAGQYEARSLVDDERPCNGNDRCIQGYFIGGWLAPGGSGLGGGSDHGLSVVRLTG